MFIINGRQGSNIDEEELSKIDAELTSLADLSYDVLNIELAKRGNTPGCHQPLLLVLARLILYKNIRNVLELGSGMTTFYLASLTHKVKGRLITLEQYQQWYDLNKSILDALRIEHHNYILLEKPSDLAKQNLENAKFDLVLVDSCDGRAEAVKAYSNHFHSETIILWDDCEQEQYFNRVVHVTEDIQLAKPKLFLSWTRGIATIDPAEKIDFVDFLKS